MKESAIPQLLMVYIMAVAVVLCPMGNQVADNKGAAPSVEGPGKPLSICPICISHVAGVGSEVIHRTPHPTATIAALTTVEKRKPEIYYYNI